LVDAALADVLAVAVEGDIAALAHAAATDADGDRCRW
jgi:hypothetical protein